MKSGKYPQEQNGDFEIDVQGFVRAVWVRKLLLAGFIASAVALGWVAFRKMPAKYMSTVTFALGGGYGPGSKLQQLAMLAGSGSMDQDGSPFVSHLSEFVRSREVSKRMLGLKWNDSALIDVLFGHPADRMDSLYGFHGSVNSMCALKRNGDLSELSCVSRNPALSAFLAKNFFKAIADGIEEKRRESLRRKIVFTDSLVEAYRKEYDGAANHLKDFMMKNMDVTSPDLIQKREALMLEKRMDEERYLFSIKEQEELRIQYRQYNPQLVVLDGAMVPLYPFSPNLPKVMAAFLMAFLFAYAILVAYLDRKSWLKQK